MDISLERIEQSGSDWTEMYLSTVSFWIFQSRFANGEDAKFVKVT